MKIPILCEFLKLRCLVILVILNACVERIDFNVPASESQMVVEGMISDGPGPYRVKLSTALNLDADSSVRSPVEKAQIRLYDDAGNVENFSEMSPGVYMTGGMIQGQVGRAYHIVIETAEGNVFESEPDRIYPAGSVETIRYTYEARTIQMSYGVFAADVFNIYVDAHAGTGDEQYVRWRFKGTYKVATKPELRTTWLQGDKRFRDPLPCSGYVVIGGAPEGVLLQVDDCTCCTCWVNEFESVPQLSDVQRVSGNQFKNIKIAEVPINSQTFYDKYMVEVEQMSLSKKSFEFFKLVRSLKEDASSLFQPPAGRIKGNVKAVNNKNPVVGIFWATAVKSKSIFINRSEVPYNLPPEILVTDACTEYYPNSSTNQPEQWE